MFLLNHYRAIAKPSTVAFTIQNVSIKYFKFYKYQLKTLDLQYKMFLLNLIFLKLPI